MECNLIREDDNWGTSYTCSNCRDTWLFGERTPKENNYNYCPHCGAKIVEVIELEEE